MRDDQAQFRHTRFVVPPKPKMSAVSLTIGIVLILGLLVGGGATIRMLAQKRAAEKAESLATISKAIENNPDRTAGYPNPRPTTKPGAEPINLEPSKLFSTDLKTQDWDRVQEAYRTSSPELALVALADFVRMSPNSTFASEAKLQMDDCLDRLWWARIKSLCDDRTALAKKVADVDQSIKTVRANGAVPERIAELEADRAPFTKVLSELNDRLAEMKFTASRTPDLYDDSQLAGLRKLRNAEAFAQWKKKTLAYITANRGKVPW